jgi:hypothetical protein
MKSLGTRTDRECRVGIGTPVVRRISHLALFSVTAIYTSPVISIHSPQTSRCILRLRLSHIVTIWQSPAMSVDPTTQQAFRGLDFAPTPARSNSQSSDELKQEDCISDKLEQSGAVSVSSDASGNRDEVVFTEAEDKAVRRKLDLIVMPILFLGFYVFQVSPRASLPIH